MECKGPDCGAFAFGSIAFLRLSHLAFVSLLLAGGALFGKAMAVDLARYAVPDGWKRKRSRAPR